MARMTCKCGEVLSNSEAPNDVQLRVYTDREWDAIFQEDMIETWKIPLPKYEVWRCKKCDRIYVFPPHTNKAIRVYMPEE